MNTVELDELMALNDQLLALNEAGVPVDAGQEISPRDLSTTLERINATVARRASRGESLEQALEDDAAAPTWYRNLIVSGLRRDNMEAALREFSRMSNSADESRFVTQSALFYPLVVSGFAYLGMIGFCLFFVPALQDAYASFGIQPGTGLIVLEKLRETLPFWIAIPPVLLLLLIAWRFRRRSPRALSHNDGTGLLASISGTSRAMFDERCAYFAESLAALEQNNVPLEKALALAAGLCGESSLAEGARSLAANIAGNQTASGDSPGATRFPPFMRWALFQSEPMVDRKRALQMAAALYREASIHTMQRARVIAPIIWLVLLGGSVTLMYGLALFVPVVQLLKAAATVH